MLQHQYQEVVPTVGFKVEQFQKNNIEFTMFDMSGASTHRDLWATYYKECDAVIYVIDCKDKLRVCVAEQELSRRQAPMQSAIASREGEATQDSLAVCLHD